MQPKIKNLLKYAALSIAIISSTATANTFKNNTQADLKAYKNQQVINKIVAIVNSKIITLNDVNSEVFRIKTQISPEKLKNISTIDIEKEALQKLIDQSVMLQLANNLHITISDAQTQRTIDNILAQHSITKDVLKQQLSKNGISIQDYEKTIKNQLIIHKLQQESISNKVYISPSEIKSYIQKNKLLREAQNSKYLIQNIFIAINDKKTLQQASNEADNIIKSVNDKKITFSEAAKKYSESVNAQKGGYLGWHDLNSLPIIYQSEAFKLKKQQVSQPIIKENGISIIYLKDVKRASINKSMINQYRISQIAIKLSPIVSDIDAKARLERILVDLKNNKSFSSLAKANSQNYDNAYQGGDMGWTSINSMPKAIADTVEKLPLNTVSKPFKVGNTWQIIKLVGKRKHDNTANIEKVEAMNAIFDTKSRPALKSWLLSQRQNAYIKIVDTKLANSY